MPGIGDVLSPLRDGVIAINNLGKTLAKVFPQATAVSTSATAGSATLPGAPAKFITVILADGTTGKVPIYNP